MERVVIALGLDPAKARQLLPATNDNVMFLPDAEAVLDELWVHEREVTAIVIEKDHEDSVGFKALAAVLDRYWPKIELKSISPSPLRAHPSAWDAGGGTVLFRFMPISR